MRKAIAILLATASAGALSFASAAEKKTTKTETPVNEDVVSGANEATRAMLGYYTGKFRDSKITVRLEKLIGQSVTGYSIVKGNERAFSGSYSFPPDGSVKLVLREPGNLPSDGEFQLTLNPRQPVVEGEWVPASKKLAKVALSLPKREWKYVKNVGQYPQSSQKVLKEGDLANLKSEELRMMRNEMYARHGYSFQLADMQKHFDAQEWYMPLSTDVTDQLTDTEKKNHALIKRYEDYGAQYYDRFGR